MTLLRLLSLVTLLAFTQSHVTAAPLDISSESPYCKASNKSYPKLKDLVIPAWKSVSNEALTVTELNKIIKVNPKLRTAMQGPVDELNEIAHALNSGYIENVRESLYVRLTSAAEANIDIRKYQSELNEMAARCARPDLSGQPFVSEAETLKQMPSQVLNDYRTLQLPTDGEELYLRKLAVAAIEAKRIEKVLRFLMKRLQKADQGPQDLKAITTSLAENERRLIRLHFMFPVLGDINTAKVESLLYSELVTAHLGFMEGDSIFWSAPKLEAWLGLNSAGGASATLGPVPFAPVEQNSGLSSYYTNLYARILRGEDVFGPNARFALLDAIDASIHSAVTSAKLKCANPSPCSALSVDPELSVNWIKKLGKQNTLGPLACACRIGEGRETVPAKINLGLGLASAGAVVAAMLQPELTPIVYAAWILSASDMAAAGAGVYDGVDSYYRMRRLVASRSGGAVSEHQRELTKADVTRAYFTMIYDFGTGVVGFLPPAKMTAVYAKVPLRTVLRDGSFLKGSTIEVTKGATAAAPPDLVGENYSAAWDPRRITVALPRAAARKYPALWKNLQAVAGKGEFVDQPAARDKLILELKTAAEKMAIGDAEDRQLLARGQIRRSLCVSKRAKTLSFVK